MISPFLFISSSMISMLVRSYKYRAFNDDFIQSSARPPVFALFHSTQMLVAAYRTPFKTNIMVSLSKDGEIAAGVLKMLGFGVVRGSSSKRGKEALNELTELVKQGESAAITVDGPRGPREEVKNGIILLAQRTGTPVVCISASARPMYRFKNSWDNFIFAPPFSKVNIYFSDPIYVNEREGVDLDYYKNLIRDNLISLANLSNELLCKDR